MVPGASGDASQSASRHDLSEKLLEVFPVFNIWWRRPSQGCVARQEFRQVPGFTKTLDLLAICFSNPAKFVTGFRRGVDRGRTEGMQDKIYHLTTIPL